MIRLIKMNLGSQKCVIKCKTQKLQKCLEINEKILRSQQRFRSDVQNVFTEKINKIALSSNDYKRFGVISNPYSTAARRVYKIDLIEYIKVENWI